MVNVQKSSEPANRELLRKHVKITDERLALMTTTNQMTVLRDAFRTNLVKYLIDGRHRINSYDAVSNERLYDVTDELTLEYLTTSPLIMSNILQMFAKGGDERERSKDYMAWIKKYSRDDAKSMGTFILAKDSNAIDIQEIEDYTVSRIYCKGLVKIGMSESRARALTNTAIEGPLRRDSPGQPSRLSPLYDLKDYELPDLEKSGGNR